MVVGVWMCLQFDLRWLLDGADHGPEFFDGGDSVGVYEGVEPGLAGLRCFFGVVVERPGSVESMGGGG